MELRDYLEILGRRKWVIILAIFFTVTVVAIGVIVIPPKYTATSQIRVLTTKTGSAQYIEYNISYAERLLATYVSLATSKPAIEELNRDVPNLDPEDILRIVKVQVIPNTELIEIKVTSEDAGLTEFVANKLAEIIVKQSKALYSEDVNPVSIYIVEHASIPTIPSSPSPTILLSLGIIAGLIGGIGLAFLFENLDKRLYSSNQIETATQLKTIGDIPKLKDTKEDILISDSRLHVEAFHRLQTNIFSQLKEKSQHKTILITSAVSQDGKSFVAANLGLSLAQSSKEVLIIDANLRWPLMHKIFQTENQTGFSDLVRHNHTDSWSKDSDLEKLIKQTIIQTSFPNLYVIPSGPLPQNPVDLLNSPRVHEVIHILKEKFDVILIDSPACLSVTDPVVLSSNVDDVLIVVRMGWVRKEVLVNSIRQLQNANANMIGVVANKTTMGLGSRLAK
jgi:polysaccharide biosynthesis transport protein